MTFLLSLLILFADESKLPQITDAEQARFFRNLYNISRAKEQAKQIEEASTRDNRALIDEWRKRGCVPVESDKGLICQAPTPPEAAKK